MKEKKLYLVSVLKIKFYSTRKILWGRPDLTRQNIFVGWYQAPDKYENHSINQDYFYTSLSLLSVWRGCKPTAYILFVCDFENLGYFWSENYLECHIRKFRETYPLFFSFTSIYCVFFYNPKYAEDKEFQSKKFIWNIFDIQNENLFHVYVFHIKPEFPQIKIVICCVTSTITGVQLSLYKVNIILSQGNDIQLQGGL